MARQFADKLEQALMKATESQKSKLQEGFSRWRDYTVVSAIEASEDKKLKG